MTIKHKVFAAYSVLKAEDVNDYLMNQACVDVTSITELANIPTGVDLARVTSTGGQLYSRGTNGAWNLVGMEPGCVATASAPLTSSSVPGNAVWGPGAFTVTAQRGGWAAGAADRLVAPSELTAAGLYVVTVNYNTGTGGSGWGARNFAQVNVNSTDVNNPTLRSPIGSTGDTRGTATWLLQIPASATLYFTFFTSHVGYTATSTDVRLSRVDAAL